MKFALPVILIATLASVMGQGAPGNQFCDAEALKAHCETELAPVPLGEIENCLGDITSPTPGQIGQAIQCIQDEASCSTVTDVTCGDIASCIAGFCSPGGNRKNLRA